MTAPNQEGVFLKDIGCDAGVVCYRYMKGMRVFPPQEHEKLAQVLRGWTDAAVAYGFRQYKTSVLESVDIYADKTSEEIMSEQTYRFVDRGGRDVLLRPEITPGVSTMTVDLQKKREFKTPFKVFSIGSVFRYENTQKGRSREHIQFNVDLFGDATAWSDAEVIAVAFEAMERMGFQKSDFVVRLNDRATLESTLTSLGLSDNALRDALRLLDKREKMTEKEFAEQLSLHDITAVALDDALREVPESVRKVMELLPDTISATYDPKIIRGFDYYTGVVFEIYARDPKVASRSVAGGGRYDTLITSYGGDPLPAVGFGMGDVVLLDCLEAYGLVTVPSSAEVALYVCDEQHLLKGVQAAAALRQHVSVSFIGVVPEKKSGAIYKYYEQLGVRYVVGLVDGSFAVRVLSTRKTELFTTAEDVITFVTDAT